MLAVVEPWQPKTGPVVKPLTEADNAWRRKASALIGLLSRAAYQKANTKPDGTRYKERRVYAVPDVAKELVECLNTNNEERAKSLMLYSYELKGLDWRDYAKT